MVMKDTGTCSFQEIGELRSHITPEEAFIAFCKQNVAVRPIFRGIEMCKTGSLYGYYVFSSPVHHSGKKYYADVLNGEDFAEFLTTNGLGTVWAGPAVKNTVFHPEHSNRLWVWIPDKEAVKAWWEKEGKKKK